MALGRFVWHGGEEALLQYSWLGRPNLESVQVTPSAPPDAAVRGGGKL